MTVTNAFTKWLLLTHHGPFVLKRSLYRKKNRGSFSHSNCPLFLTFLHCMPTNKTFELSIKLPFKIWWHFHFAHIRNSFSSERYWPASLFLKNQLWSFILFIAMENRNLNSISTDRYSKLTGFMNNWHLLWYPQLCPELLYYFASQKHPAVHQLYIWALSSQHHLNMEIIFQIYRWGKVC